MEKITIGYIGLGKMGLNMVKRLREYAYPVVVSDPNEEARADASKTGADTYKSATEVVQALSTPRTVWIMVPHSVVDEVLDEISEYLEDGDTVIDGGNSRYTLSVERAKRLRQKNITFMDVGVSGGPAGARNGACLMVGGAKSEYDRLVPLFETLAVEGGYGYMGEAGAGHFVKMVHNGIEYGMMQAIAEGFDIMNTSSFDLDLAEVARVYRHGSVIESRLIDWTEEAYREWGSGLEDVSGSAHASGEGDWTVEAADEHGVEAPVIKDALQARYASQENPNYQGKVIMALRNKFGGHDLGKNS